MTARRPQDLLGCPVVVAPMAGGPSTPELVVAAGGAGPLGFLAAGYKNAAAMRKEMDAVRAAIAEPFGVNVFVPGAPTRHRSALPVYLDSLAPDAAALGAGLGKPVWDDDDWAAKISTLLDSPPAVVSFTFGCPEAGLVSAIRAVGSQT